MSTKTVYLLLNRHTLCMNQFVASSGAVFEAAIWVKSNVYDEIAMKKKEKKNMEIDEIYTL